MAETTIYQKNNVNITDTRAILDGKTYAMANVTSVQMGIIPPNRLGPALVIGLGLLIALFAGNSFGVLVFGLLVVAGGIFWWIKQKGTYLVRLGSASGEVDGMRSKDKEQVEQICAAINEAIIKRG